MKYFYRNYAQNNVCMSKMADDMKLWYCIKQNLMCSDFELCNKIKKKKE